MKSIGLSNRDIFNARNGAKIQGSEGVTGKLVGLAINEEGDKKTSVLKIDDTIYSGTSSTVYEDAKILIENFEDEIKAGTLDVVLTSKTSKAGRTFYNIELR